MDGSLINSSFSNCSITCELAAVVLAIFVSPPLSTFTIFTDCASIDQHFQYLNNLSPFSYRNIFKQQSLPLLWSILMHLLSENNISLTFKKVKDTHSSSITLSFLPQNLPVHSIVPKWNNIVIDSHL
ncbi:hypothetical protein C1645_823074 [Glomus cerebriforme]|uniref:RNase H type-1 domain-containing protein n=1 Tax=Glomus cerebriforme TaxID=658196 RepID=A0A397SX49_9GLOM|nr:hypothetical protein C1645_823074 [Glomus cerebriforme]